MCTAPEAFLAGYRRPRHSHYMAGPSCYVPDAMFIIGPVSKYEGLFTVTGCCGGGVAAGGGMGRLAAELITGEKPFVSPGLFAPERFGEVDPFSAEFQKRCADARSNKKADRSVLQMKI